MDKEKLQELMTLLQELIGEALKNPTFKNVRSMVAAEMLYDCIYVEDQSLVDFIHRSVTSEKRLVEHVKL